MTYKDEVYKWRLAIFSIWVVISVVTGIITAKDYLRLRDEPIGWLLLFLTIGFPLLAAYFGWQFVKTRRELRAGDEKAD